MKQHYFDVPFAFAGDVTAIPDPLQVGGTVSMTEGWNNNYQRNLSTDPAALPIDRSTTNWLLLQISTAIQALQQAGVPEFILASQNGGAAYSYGKGACVLWSASGNAPFGKYVSLTAGNTNTPSASDPQGLTTGWQIEVDPIATAAQASAGTDDASIMTPLKVAQQTALRALLAGSSSQVFNVAPATASTHAPQFQQLTGAIGFARNINAVITTAGSSLTVFGTEVQVEDINGLRYVANLSPSVTFNGTGTGANGMDTGGIPASGFLAFYCIYNPTTGTSAVLGVNAASLLTERYSGANLPSGYTASALLFVVPTTAGNLIAPCVVKDRSTDVLNVTGFTTNAPAASPTIVNVLSVPLNAKYVSGLINCGSTAASTVTFTVYSSSVATGGQTCAVALSGGGSIQLPLTRLKLSVAQRMYYVGTNSGGTPTYTTTVNSWEI